MSSDLNINSPMFFEFRAGLEGCVAAMLKAMIEKKANCGTVTAQLGFELQQKIVVNEETGETETVYVPSIEHKIKGKIGFESGNIKGAYKGKDLALYDAGKGWSVKNISGQPSLF